MPELRSGLQRLNTILQVVVAAVLISASASAVAAVQDSEVAEAEGGRTYNLPLGDHTVSSVGRAPQVWADPVVFANTRQTKGLVGGEDSGDQAPDFEIAQPRAILKECPTLTSDGGETPANPQGAVSRLRLVVTTLTEIAVFNRNDCSLMSRLSTQNFFAVQFPVLTQSFSDARVIYDFASQRFFISAMGVNSETQDTFLYFAVSTSNTAAAWRIFRIGIKVGSKRRCIPSLNNSWGVPNPGVNTNRWLIAAERFAPGSGVSGSIMSLEKEPTLGSLGVPKFKCFNGLENQLVPPIVRGTATTAYFLSVGAVSGNSIRRYALDTAGAVDQDSIIGGGPTLVSIPAWTAPPYAPQPNGQRLLTSDGEFLAPTIQVGPFLWNVHTINVNGKARWRLYKLSQSGPEPLFVFTPKTAPGLHHNFNASVATGSKDPDAPAFVTFTRVRPNNERGRAELMIAKGPNSSAAGWTSTMVERSPSQFELLGNTGPATCNEPAFNTACRWGKYSSTQMDPANGTRAWGFNQLAIGPLQGDWIVRAGQVD